MNTNMPYSSMASLDGRMISMEDISRLLYQREGSFKFAEAHDNTAFLRCPTPPPDYDADASFTYAIDTTITMEVNGHPEVPANPDPYYADDESSIEGNSDTTFVVGEGYASNHAQGHFGNSAVEGHLSNHVGEGRFGNHVGGHFSNSAEDGHFRNHAVDGHIGNHAVGGYFGNNAEGHFSNHEEVHFSSGALKNVNSQNSVVGSKMLECPKVSWSVKQPAYRGIQDRYGLENWGEICSRQDPRLILYPPRLSEILDCMDQSPNSSRIQFSLDHQSPPVLSRFGYCGSAQMCWWLVALVFVITSFVLLVHFYPGSRAVWLCLVALIVLSFAGLANFLPSQIRKHYYKRDIY